MEIIMKKVTTAVWLIILAFIILLIYQNQAFFLESKQSLNLNLILAQYKTPELQVVYFCGAFALAGFLFGLYFLAAYGLKTKKKTKVLKAQVNEQTEKITNLEGELNTIKGAPAAESLPTPPPEADTVVINPEDAPEESETRK